jgi:hypothetical protein
MGKKKKEIKIIKKDSNKEDYTFVSNDNILNNVKSNDFARITNNDKKFENKSNEIIEKKKVHSKKADNKGRKTLGKSLQGHSPIYE